MAVIGEAIAGLRLAWDLLRNRDERKKFENARLAATRADIRLVTNPKNGEIGTGDRQGDDVWIMMHLENKGAEARNLRLSVIGNRTDYYVEGSRMQSLPTDSQAHVSFKIPLINGCLPEPDILFRLRVEFDDDSETNRLVVICRRFKGGAHPDWREWGEPC